jgi:hypothetical protein
MSFRVVSFPDKSIIGFTTEDSKYGTVYGAKSSTEFGPLVGHYDFEGTVYKGSPQDLKSRSLAGFVKHNGYGNVEQVFSKEDLTAPVGFVSPNGTIRNAQNVQVAELGAHGQESGGDTYGAGGAALLLLVNQKV